MLPKELAKSTTEMLNNNTSTPLFSEWEIAIFTAAAIGCAITCILHMRNSSGDIDEYDPHSNNDYDKNLDHYWSRGYKCYTPQQVPSWDLHFKMSEKYTLDCIHGGQAPPRPWASNGNWPEKIYKPTYPYNTRYVHQYFTGFTDETWVENLTDGLSSGVPAVFFCFGFVTAYALTDIMLRHSTISASVTVANDFSPYTSATGRECVEGFYNPFQVASRTCACYVFISPMSHPQTRTFYNWKKWKSDERAKKKEKARIAALGGAPDYPFWVELLYTMLRNPPHD